MNIDNIAKLPMQEFDKTYLKERFKLPYLEDTLQINNYVDILSLIYNKLDSNKPEFKCINYEYPAEIKVVMELFASGKCEIMYNNDIVHNALTHLTPIICIKEKITKTICYREKNYINYEEYVDFYFNDIQYIRLDNDLYNIKLNDNKYCLTSGDSKNTIMINTKQMIYYMSTKEKQKNTFKILILDFYINDNYYVLFNIMNKKNIDDLHINNMQFNIGLTLDELYKNYLNSVIFKNINKLSVFYKNIEKLSNEEKTVSIWHSAKTPFNLCFGFIDTESNLQQRIDFSIFLPPSDKFIKLSDKKIDQYCQMY